MITFLFSIDVKKQALSGLFFFYPNLSMFLCNRFGKAHDQTAWTKEILYLWAMCGLSYCFDLYLRVSREWSAGHKERKETIMYNQT